MDATSQFGVFAPRTTSSHQSRSPCRAPGATKRRSRSSRASAAGVLSHPLPVLTGLSRGIQKSFGDTATSGRPTRSVNRAAPACLVPSTSRMHRGRLPVCPCPRCATTLAPYRFSLLSLWVGKALQCRALPTSALGSLETRKRRFAAQRYPLPALRVNSELHSVGCAIEPLSEMLAKHFVLGILAQIAPRPHQSGNPVRCLERLPAVASQMEGRSQHSSIRVIALRNTPGAGSPRTAPRHVRAGLIAGVLPGRGA